MAIYLYDSSTAAQIAEERIIVKKYCAQVVACGVSLSDQRIVVRTLTRHDLLLTPSDVAAHTPLLQRMIMIAHGIGLEVKPLVAYTSTDKRVLGRMNRLRTANAPAAACAVPPTQHPAAVGQNI